MKTRPRCRTSFKYPDPCPSIHACAVMMITFLLTLSAGVSCADTNQPLTPSKIKLEKLWSGDNSGYGYKPQYLVSVPIKSFWQFKTDFTGESLLTNDELIGHRLVNSVGSSVITEYRYASASDFINLTILQISSFYCMHTFPNTI